MFWKIPILKQNLLRKTSNRLDTRRYFGGGGSSVETFDPFRNTGVRELYKQLTGWISPQIGQGVEAYPGQITAGYSPLQTTGFDLAANLGGMSQLGQNYFSDVLGYAMPEQASNLLNMAQQNLASATTPMDTDAATAYWNKAFVDPAMRNWQDIIAPAIMEKYGTDGVGGALGQQLARSGENLATNLSGQLADIQYQGQQNALSRQMQGAQLGGQLAMTPGNIVSQAGQIGGQGTDMLSQLLNMGQMQRGVNQELLSEPYQKWSFEQPYNNPYLLNFLQTTLQQPGTTPVVQQEAPGLGTQLLSGMMPSLGMGLGQSLFGGGLEGLGYGISGLFSPGVVGTGGEMMAAPGLIAGAGQGLMGLGSAAMGGLGALGGGLAGLAALI